MSVTTSTAAVVFTEPKLLSYKELRRLLLGWPGVGRCRPVARLLVFKEKAVRPANHCCCRTTIRSHWRNLGDLTTLRELRADVFQPNTCPRQKIRPKNVNGVKS